MTTTRYLVPAIQTRRSHAPLTPTSGTAASAPEPAPAGRAATVANGRTRAASTGRPATGTPTAPAGSQTGAARTAQSRQQPPCAGSPNTWDLDVGTPDSWRIAVQTCRSCPLFAECGRQAQALIARGDGPRAVIWAAVAYDSAGKVVENLDCHRTNSVDNRRPLRIIRHGVRPQAVEPAPATPRRHLVLGRPLRPTGTAAC